VSLAALVAVAACVLPAAGQAALVTFGSGLGAPASVAIAHPVDTAFWSTALSGGAHARAPQGGQVLAVRVRGCAERGTGGQVPLTQVRFQVLTPGGGSGATVKVTSGPSNLPVCGGSVSGATVSTFHPVNLCVGAGDYVAFNDAGGFAPAGFPRGVEYEVFASAPGAATDSFTSAGGTNNGSHLRGRAHAGLELLMQMQLGTGRNASPLCG
jgi:hypothetical protein